MRPAYSSPLVAGARLRAIACALLVPALLVGACNGPQPLLWKWPVTEPPPANPAPTGSSPAAPPPAPAYLAANDPVTADDNPLKPMAAPELKSAAPELRQRLDVLLTVMNVQIPQAERDRARPLWNYLRENVLDSATVLRLRQNGLRVGIGNEQWWEAIKAVLDALSGVRTIARDPIQMPLGFPLGLELDTAPREQTLFFLSADGVLTGETWPESRNVLRVSYGLTLESPTPARRGLRLSVVPEVRQHLPGFRWVRTETGLATQLPDYKGRAFDAAHFDVDLAPGEFVVIAPNEQADLYGIVGGAFLTSAEEDKRYDSYMFLRLDVKRVAERN